MVETTLSSALNVLKEFGVFDVYLPFLLTFAIFYGILRKMNLFDSNRITAVISGIVAAYVMIFSPAAIPISQFFSTFFAQASVLFVILLVGMMVVGILWSSPYLGFTKLDLGKLSPWIVLIAILIVIAMFFSSGGAQLFTRILPPGFRISGEDMSLILLILITVGVIALLVGTGGEEKKQGLVLPFKV